MFTRQISLTFLGAVMAVSIWASPALSQSTLEVVGTGDGIDVLRALGKAFSAENKSVFVDIPPSIGSGGGIAAVGSGKSVLGRVARKLTDTETASGLVYKPVAHSAVGHFRQSECRREFADDQRNWPVSLPARFRTGRKWAVPTCGFASCDARTATRRSTVLRTSMPGWKDLTITEKSKLAMTTQEAVASVREVPGAIGFGPFSKDLEAGLTIVKIDGKYPTDDGYPSSATLALIYSKTTVTPDAKTFVEFCETKKAREIIARLGSVPAQR